MCHLGGFGYYLWGLEKKLCKKSLSNNSGILGIVEKHYGENM